MLHSDTQKCLSEFGTVTASSTFPGESTIELVETASVHTESRLLVRTFDLDGRSRITGGDPLAIELKGRKGSEVGVSITDNNDGTYSLTFRVSEADVYQATVTIFGRPIKNSPFPIHVSSHHTPRWQLNVELSQPTRAALVGDHQFYVLDTGNDRVRVVKDTGEVINDIKSPCLEGNSAVGLTVGTQDMTIVNWKTKTITKISMTGVELQAVNFSEFDQPIDLAVDRRGRYLIADKNHVS